MVEEDLATIAQANMDIVQAFDSINETLAGNETSLFYTDALNAVSLYEAVRFVGYKSSRALTHV